MTRHEWLRQIDETLPQYSGAPLLESRLQESIPLI